MSETKSLCQVSQTESGTWATEVSPQFGEGHRQAAQIGQEFQEPLAGVPKIQAALGCSSEILENPLFLFGQGTSGSTGKEATTLMQHSSKLQGSTDP